MLPLPLVASKRITQSRRARGGKVFRIVRDQKADTTSSGIAQHASEREQHEISDRQLDGIIDNNGTLEQLQETLAALLAPYRDRP